MPFIHFWPNINKDSDPGFGSVQPIEYIPLNWVINDHAFYDTNELGKTAIQFLYLNYIGVIPVLLAFISIRLVPRAAKRLMLSF